MSQVFGILGPTCTSSTFLTCTGIQLLSRPQTSDAVEGRACMNIPFDPCHPLQEPQTNTTLRCLVNRKLHCWCWYLAGKTDHAAMTAYVAAATQQFGKHNQEGNATGFLLIFLEPKRMSKDAGPRPLFKLPSADCSQQSRSYFRQLQVQ